MDAIWLVLYCSSISETNGVIVKPKPRQQQQQHSLTVEVCHAVKFKRKLQIHVQGVNPPLSSELYWYLMHWADSFCCNLSKANGVIYSRSLSHTISFDKSAKQ